MLGFIRGKIYFNEAFEIESKNLPVLTLRRPDEDSYFLHTTWGRQVLGIERRDHVISITPDRYGGLPIYVYSVDSTLYFANTFSDLLDIIPPPLLPDIDKKAVLKLLMMEHEGSGDTLLTSVKVVSGIHQMVWDGKSVKILRKEYVSATKVNDTDLKTIFTNTLSWATSLGDAKIGVTLSGGVDSAVVWAGLVAMGIQPVALTALFPGEAGNSQRAKIEQILSNSNSPWITVAGDECLFEDHSHDPYRNLYASLNDALGVKARQAGIRVVMGGEGGDELVRTVELGGPSSTIREKTVPGYFTDLALHDWELLPETDDELSGFIPSTALNMKGLTGTIGVGQGLWQERILCYPDFWQWTASLSSSWAHHKHGFREYLKEAGYTKIAGTIINEDYSGVYLKGISRFLQSPFFDSLLGESHLSQWGWIDINEVQRMKNERIQGYSRRLQYLGMIYTLEKFLQWYTKRKEVKISD